MAPAQPKQEAKPLAGLAALVFREPYRYEFFAAVRLLEAAFRDRRAVGYDNPADSEVIHFRAHPSLEFPASEICELLPPGEDEKAVRMTVAFMGLYGPQGALPRPYTELIIQRLREHDSTLRDFLDLFNHRLISLFYRAWEKYRFWYGYERAEREASRRAAESRRQHAWFVVRDRAQFDPFSQYLLDLGGYGVPALRYDLASSDEPVQRTLIDDETLRYYTGLFAQQHRSAVSLAQMLQAYFGVPVSIDQFQGQWLYLEEEFQTRLTGNGSGSAIGVNAIAGERVWDVQGRFRIRLGPLSYAQFSNFLPGGEGFAPLAQLARLYAGLHFDFDIQLILRHDEVPWCVLGGTGPDAARLGYNTWIRNAPFTHDVADSILEVEDATSCGTWGTTGNGSKGFRRVPLTAAS